MMTIANAFIYSAPVHSGKTTALMHWVENRNDVGGFLAPDIEGLRYLFTLSDRQFHPFQVEEGASSQNTVNICRYRFLAEAFALAHRMLLEDARRSMPWLVVDEVGKLELQGRGHEPALSQVIQMSRQGEYTGRLLLVVRSELLSDVVEKYALHGAQVLHTPQELEVLS
ncbi:MAG: hypothetical protein NZM43_00935 [Saprospiraceae bacterium]|nr:hypothetical protein [Saprospiraceae bacterium]MDW8482863.1 nucleoside-triphosphatase [Saprospiraceae bacterium]